MIINLWLKNGGSKTNLCKKWWLGLQGPRYLRYQKKSTTRTSSLCTKRATVAGGFWGRCIPVLLDSLGNASLGFFDLAKKSGQKWQGDEDKMTTFLGTDI